MTLRDDLTLNYEQSTTKETISRDMQMFECTLMVKDFNATGFAVSDEFMTNADTPLLALDGIVDNPVNPATGNPLDDAEKHASEHHVQWPDEWEIQRNNGNVFLPGDWFCLKGDDVLDGASWSYLGNY